MTRGTVLVVDDDPIVLEVTRERLEGAGYVVHIREEALGTSQWTAEFQPDIVLLDVNMPALTGLDLAQLLQEATSHQRHRDHSLLVDRVDRAASQAARDRRGGCDSEDGGYAALFGRVREAGGRELAGSVGRRRTRGVALRRARWETRVAHARLVIAGPHPRC